MWTKIHLPPHSRAHMDATPRAYLKKQKSAPGRTSLAEVIQLNEQLSYSRKNLILLYCFSIPNGRNATLVPPQQEIAFAGSSANSTSLRRVYEHVTAHHD